MADIIPFTPQTRRSRATGGLIPAMGAQILLFTGVRYEYFEEEPKKPRKTARKSKAPASRKGRKTA